MVDCRAADLEAVGNLTQPSALLALLTAGNRCNPYLDTVGNGSALGKPGIYDPQLDPKALKSTPIF